MSGGFSIRRRAVRPPGPAERNWTDNTNNRQQKSTPIIGTLSREANRRVLLRMRSPDFDPDIDDPGKRTTVCTAINPKTGKIEMTRRLSDWALYEIIACREWPWLQMHYFGWTSSVLDRLSFAMIRSRQPSVVQGELRIGAPPDGYLRSLDAFMCLNRAVAKLIAHQWHQSRVDRIRRFDDKSDTISADVPDSFSRDA